MMRARTVHHAFILGTLLAVLVGPAAQAQFTWTITEINPNQSTFDATDADAASGGRINSLGVAPNGTTFFAASEWGGLFRSTDTGRRWAHLPGHIPHVTFDVKVDPTNALRVFATSLYDGRVNSLAGINVSVDGGNAWSKPASATPPAGFCTATARRDEPAAYGISINPANTQNVVVGTNCGVAISNDAGGHWTFVDPTPGDGGADDVFDVVVHHGGIIDTCGNDGHRRSTDGGMTWTTATASPLPGGRCSIAASPDESNVLFAVVGISAFESDNGGTSWPNAITNPTPQGRVPFVATNQRTGSSFDLWFGDTGLHRETCTTPAMPGPGGARRCPGNGWTASFTRTAGGHDDLGDIAFVPGVANDACPVLFSSDGGVYFNTLNASPACQSPAWEQPNVTPHALWLMGMGGVNETGTASEDLYFTAQDNGPFAATDAPATPPTWNSRQCCDGFDVAADTTRVLFTQCCFAGVNRMRTSGVGMTGIGFINNLPGGSLPGFRYTDIIRRFAANSYVVVTTNGIFTTTNVTAVPIVWTQLGTATSPASPRAVEVAVSGGAPSFFVQGGLSDGLSQDRLFRFNGTGAGNWQQINPPGGTGGFGIFAVDPANPNRIIASHLRTGLTPQMIMTTNGGTNWNNLPALDTLMTGGGTFRYQNQRGLSHSGNAITQQNGYPQPTLVSFDPENANIIVAGGADSGVFVSADAGANWTLVTDPTGAASPHIPRPRFAYFDHEGGSLLWRRADVYVGSVGRGVWRIRLSLPGIVVQNYCTLHPEICRGPILATGQLQLDCSRLPKVTREPVDCVIRDPLPMNCLVKYKCPGCSPGSLCPPYYQFAFDGLDPKIWEVGVITGKGQQVPYEVMPTEKGVVVSFRPDKELFTEGTIGDYELVFLRNAGAPGDTYTLRAGLRIADKP
jgi:hypothetical protein